MKIKQKIALIIVCFLITDVFVAYTEASQLINDESVTVAQEESQPSMLDAKEVLKKMFESNREIHDSNYLASTYWLLPAEVFDLLPGLPLPNIYKGYDLEIISIRVFRHNFNDESTPLKVADIFSICAHYSNGIRIYELEFYKSIPKNTKIELIDKGNGYIIKSNETGNPIGIAVDYGNMFILQFDFEVFATVEIEPGLTISSSVYDTSEVTDENVEELLKDKEGLAVFSQVVQYLNLHGVDMIYE